jgi:uncharacterized membrane protein YeaQ/YmgE (transglycosylase-associated protein family)
MDNVIEWTKNLWQALQEVGNNLAGFFNSSFQINDQTFTFWNLLPFIIGTVLVVFVVASIVKMFLGSAD